MRRSIGAALAGVAGLAGLAIAVPALAATNQVIAQTGGAEAQITLLGVPVTVKVELNTDTGDITAVNVDPQVLPDPAGQLTATKVNPSRVRFESANGQTTVSVKARKDSLSIGARSASLQDLLGTNKWTGDVFGTKAPSTVTYTVAADGSGGPLVTIGAITKPDGVTANDLGSFGGGGDDDDGKVSGGRVEFLSTDGFRKVLTIQVRVRTGDDDDDHGASGQASLSITLKGRNVQRKATLAELVGAHTWTGLLCDGKTHGTINYTVNADGTIMVDTTDPTSTNKQNGHGIVVSFDLGTRVSISVRTSDSGQAALAVSVSGSRHCTVTPASVDPPKVNTPTSTQAPNTANANGNSRNGKNRNNGNNNGDKKHGDDD